MRTGALVFTVNDADISQVQVQTTLDSLCFSPDGKYLVIGRNDGPIQVRFHLPFVRVVTGILVY